MEEKNYKHEALPAGKYIRVLRLAPSVAFASEIKCRLEPLSLDSDILQYEALSYVWGSPVGDKRILCSGKELFVTTNCLSALRYLRRKHKPRILWIDAICIDQTSLSERSHQVELMGEVYSMAHKTLIWLDPGTNDSLMDTIKRLAMPGSIKLRDLQLEWFERIWTFQELLFSGRPTVVCGKQTLPWPALVRTAQKDRSEANIAISDQIISMENSLVTWSNVTWFKPMGFQTTVDPFEHCDIIARLWNNTYLRHASQPHDRIYGLYALLRRQGLELPVPDYQKSLVQVCQELTLAFIRSCGSLMPLHMFEQTPRLENMTSPSWMLDWMSIDGRTLRFWGQRRGQHFKWNQSEQQKLADGQFLVRGVVLGTVEPFGGEIPAVEFSALDDGYVGMKVGLLRWLGQLLELAEGFDACPDGLPAWEAALKEMFRRFDVNQHISDQYASAVNLSVFSKILLVAQLVKPTLDHHQTFLSGEPDAAEKLLDLDDDALQGRVARNLPLHLFTDCLTEMVSLLRGGAIFRTLEGHVGCTLSRPEKGDLVVLLKGSAVPAILRSVGDHFQLVGFGPVAGIPDDVLLGSNEKITERGIVLV